MDTSSGRNPIPAANLLLRTSPVLQKLTPGPELSIFHTCIHLPETSLGILWALLCLKPHISIIEGKYKFKLTQTCLSLPLCLNTDGCFCCAAAFQAMQAAKYLTGIYISFPFQTFTGFCWFFYLFFFLVGEVSFFRIYTMFSCILI